MTAHKVLPRSFYVGDALQVAPALLNKVLVRGKRAGRIVEVEAYRGSDDPASHAYRGPTPRNATMFGPPGRLYVYFTYGMHWCANVVCGPQGEAQAVLLRALAPVAGVVEMRRGRLTDRQLASGPARLCQALGITGEDDGADLVKGGRQLKVVDDGTPPPPRVAISGRVGISSAADLPWRFFVPGDPHVSRGPTPVVAAADRLVRRGPARAE
ncbi:MAG TPA: DNA-3-methyladenine glycosylase [Acidimicrobiales bacterium]|nr:DNA-3-methyladenine glycosylase [Acidimicrobiales bacterium]